MTQPDLDAMRDHMAGLERASIGAGAPALERAAAAYAQELARAAAEGRYAMRRVPHELEATEEQVELELPNGKTKRTTWTSRRNAINECPDCGRSLVGPRDQDGPGFDILVCGRIHGLRVAIAGLTPHDIVACGQKD